MDTRTQPDMNRPHPLTGTVMTGADTLVQVLADEGVKNDLRLQRWRNTADLRRRLPL